MSHSSTRLTQGIWRRSGEFGGTEYEGLSAAVTAALEWQKEHASYKLVCLIDLDTYLGERDKHDGMDTRGLVKQYILPHPDCVLFDGAPASDSKPASTSTGKPRRDPDHSPFWWDLRDKSGNLKVSPDAVWAAVVASSKSCN